ncbi:MAG: Eco29kI family restriction endonuclease [Chloroflexia bacterium]|nr:Eco29kI family restriction endonuclease [Chloroflexia bacterium]
MWNPLWNSGLDGFGNHDPGRGRYNQAKSEWDVLHPGRPWAERLTGASPGLKEIIEKARVFLEGVSWLHNSFV